MATASAHHYGAPASPCFLTISPLRDTPNHRGQPAHPPPLSSLSLPPAPPNPFTVFSLLPSPILSATPPPPSPTPLPARPCTEPHRSHHTRTRTHPSSAVQGGGAAIRRANGAIPVLSRYPTAFLILSTSSHCERSAAARPIPSAPADTFVSHSFTPTPSPHPLSSPI